MAWNCPAGSTRDRDTLTDTYGKFYAEPFERGFGITVGNSLRRILLSSLEGSAVTRVKIQGVQHEITRSPAWSRTSPTSSSTSRAWSSRTLSDQPQDDPHRPRTSRASSRRPTSSPTRRSQIINPEHILATLTDDVPFVVEMTVENGRGYRTADENAGKEREIGVIPVDSSFSPGRPRQVRDRGHPRRPEDQLRQAGPGDLDQRHRRRRRWPWSKAAKILRKHLNPFVQYAEPGPEMPLDDRADDGRQRRAGRRRAGAQART